MPTGFFIVEYNKDGKGREVFECNTAREGREVLQEMRETRPGTCAILCDREDGNRIIAEIE